VLLKLRNVLTSAFPVPDGKRRRLRRSFAPPSAAARRPTGMSWHDG
jgi:hypothetical protein